MARLVGTKWGASATGTAGGVVTWSLAGAGEFISRFGGVSGRSTTGDSFLSFDYEQIISDAFADWSTSGNIEFIRVEDQGGAAGQQNLADIRIFFGAIPGNVIGWAYYPTRNASAIAGDILLDTWSGFNSNQDEFRGLVLHELGHALGLGHVSANSVMTPYLSETTLQADDRAGIRVLYGPQDGADPVYNVKVGWKHIDIVEGLGSLTVNANGKSNWISGADGNETINGAGGNDRLNGRDGADELNGGNGKDTLEGGAGADRLDGGDGFDAASYGSAPSGVGVDLALGVAGWAGEALGDTLVNIEKIFGSAHGDTVLGDDLRNWLMGEDGDDHLTGRGARDRLKGGEGNDTLDGGADHDRLDGEGGNDLLQGMAGKDKMRGGDGDDRLEGGDDRDKLFGGNGFDTLESGAGNDKISGGSDSDTFVFVDGHGRDKIVDFDASDTQEKIDLSGISALNDISEVLAATTRKVGSVVIDTGGGDAIVLVGVSLGALDADDFLF